MAKSARFQMFKARLPSQNSGRSVTSTGSTEVQSSSSLGSLTTDEKLRHLGASALDVLEDQLKAGNTRVALALLKQVQEESCPSSATTVAEAIRVIATEVELTHLLQRLDPNRDHPLAKAMRLLWGEEDDGEQ